MDTQEYYDYINKYLNEGNKPSTLENIATGLSSFSRPDIINTADNLLGMKLGNTGRGLLTGIGGFAKGFARGQAAARPYIDPEKVKIMASLLNTKAKTKSKSGYGTGSITPRALYDKSRKLAYDKIMGTSLEQWTASGGDPVDWWTNAEAKANPSQIAALTVDIYNKEAPVWGIPQVKNTKTFKKILSEIETKKIPKNISINNRGFIKNNTYAVINGKLEKINSIDEYNTVKNKNYPIQYK